MTRAGERHINHTCLFEVAPHDAELTPNETIEILGDHHARPLHALSLMNSADGDLRAGGRIDTFAQPVAHRKDPGSALLDEAHQNL